MKMAKLFLLVQSVIGVNIRGQVQIESLRDFDYQTKVELDNKQQYLTENGDFEFNNIDKGVYILQIISTQYVFPRTVVVVNEDGISAFESPLGSSLDQVGSPIPYPLELKAQAALDYSQLNQAFTIMSLFGNPMLLMSGITLLMLFFLPKLKDNLIDPETEKEVLLKNSAKKKEDQIQMQMPDVASNLADWFAQSQKSSPKSKRKNKA